LLVPSEVLATTLEILHELLINDKKQHCDKEMSAKMLLYLDRLESSPYQEMIQLFFKVKPKEKENKAEIASLRPPLMKAPFYQIENVKVYEKIVIVKPVVAPIIPPKIIKLAPPAKESFEALVNLVETPKFEKLEARVEEVQQIKEMLVGAEIDDIPIETATIVIEYLLNTFDDVDHVVLVSASALSVLAQSRRNREIMLHFDGLKKLISILDARFDLELIEQVLGCLHHFAKKGTDQAINDESRVFRCDRTWIRTPNAHGIHPLITC
jgi:hypothetical protein